MAIALVSARIAFAAPPATPPPPCAPNAVAGVIVSGETLYQGQQFESAATIVRLGLESCGAGAADLARLHLLEGMLKIEAFKEEEARAAFAAALALDADPTLPAFMPPAAKRMFEAVKATVPARPARPARKELKVLEVVGGRAVFAAGTEDGFHPGSKVRVVSQQAPSSRAAVLRVVQAQAHTAMAELGRGDQVQPGDLVLPTDEPLSEHLFFPRRASFTSRIGFRVRPMVTYPTDFGAVGDVYYSHYFKDFPISLQARLGPAGTTFLQATGAVALTAAFETDLFAIGLGAGAAVGHYAGSSATFNQILRLGSLDGLNVAWESSLFFGGNGGAAFRAELDVPLLSRFSLFADGGLWANGLTFGEFGLHMYRSGGGTPGTFILSVSGGIAGLGPTGAFEMGPALGFGMEWRL